MIFAIWMQQGKCCEALNDLCAGLRTGESLKQFLEDQPCRDDNVGTQQGLLEYVNFRFRRCAIAAQGERPNARVNE